MVRNGGTCFLCGIVFGASVALLFAPRSGARTRAEIRRRTRDTRGYLREQTSQLAEQVNDKLDRTSRAVRETASGIAKAFSDGRYVLTR